MTVSKVEIFTKRANCRRVSSVYRRADTATKFNTIELKTRGSGKIPAFVYTFFH